MPRISALPAATATTGAELLAIVQDGHTRKVALNALADAIGAFKKTGGTVSGDVNITGSGTFGSDIIGKRDLIIGDVNEDSERFMNIIGAGNDRKFGIQLAGSPRLWTSTAAIGITHLVGSDGNGLHITPGGNVTVDGSGAFGGHKLSVSPTVEFTMPDVASALQVQNAAIWSNNGTMGLITGGRLRPSDYTVFQTHDGNPVGEFRFNPAGKPEWLLIGMRHTQAGNIAYGNAEAEMLSNGSLIAKFGETDINFYRHLTVAGSGTFGGRLTAAGDILHLNASQTLGAAYGGVIEGRGVTGKGGNLRLGVMDNGAISYAITILDNSQAVEIAAPLRGSSTAEFAGSAAFGGDVRVNAPPNTESKFQAWNNFGAIGLLNSAVGKRGLASWKADGSWDRWVIDIPYDSSGSAIGVGVYGGIWLSDSPSTSASGTEVVTAAWVKAYITAHVPGATA